MIAILVSLTLILFFLFLINNKRENLGDSGVLFFESNKEVHGKVINFFKVLRLAIHYQDL